MAQTKTTRNKASNGATVGYEQELWQMADALRGGQPGVGAELVRFFPETFLKCVGGCVFLRRSDPLHSKSLFWRILRDEMAF